MLSVELVQGVSKKTNKAYFGIKTKYTYEICGELIEKEVINFIDKERFLLINEQLKKEC